MTVGELRKKLELYRDDTEIFLWQYDDICCQDHFSDPVIIQEEVRINTAKKTGREYYTKWSAQVGAKQHTVLVLA